MYFISSAWFQQIQVNISEVRDISHTNSRILVLLGTARQVFFSFSFFLTVLGLCYFVRVFSSCSKQGLLFVAVGGLILVASLVQSAGCRCSVVAALGFSNAVHELNCSEAGRIFLNQGWNPCALHWQADFLIQLYLSI